MESGQRIMSEARTSGEFGIHVEVGEDVFCLKSS